MRISDWSSDVCSSDLSHVAEHLINKMLEREPLISILKGYYPLNAEKSGRRLTTVVFQEMEGTDTRIAEGDIFADCSYEGDLAAVTGVATRIGRESRDAYGEEYAGRKSVV